MRGITHLKHYASADSYKKNCIDHASSNILKPKSYNLRLELSLLTFFYFYYNNVCGVVVGSKQGMTKITPATNFLL